MSYDNFIRLSVDLTAFRQTKLIGTGYAKKYYDFVAKVVGTDIFDALLATYFDLSNEAADDADFRKSLIRKRLLSSAKFGPITRNIIKLWFVSTWYELPQTWRDQYGTSANDGTQLVDAWAYPEGLLWPAVGAHPAGAKAPGYGTWTKAPSIPAIDC